MINIIFHGYHGDSHYVISVRKNSIINNFIKKICKDGTFVAEQFIITDANDSARDFNSNWRPYLEIRYNKDDKILLLREAFKTLNMGHNSRIEWIYKEPLDLEI